MVYPIEIPETVHSNNMLKHNGLSMKDIAFKFSLSKNRFPLKTERCRPRVQRCNPRIL